MTSKLPETPHAADKSEQPAAPRPEDEQPVNRRLMMGVGLLGVATFLAAACSGSNFSSGAKNTKKENTTGGATGGGDDDDSGASGPVLPTGSGKITDPLIMPVGSTKNVKDLLPSGTKIQGGDSSNAAVATFDPKTGEIKAIAPGDAIITIETPTGKKQIYVTVKLPKDIKPGASGTGSNPGSGPTGGEVGDGSGNLQNSIDTGADACYANTVTKLDLGAIDAATEAMTPDVVFYGTAKSTLVAVRFKGPVPIMQLVIAREDGQLLALHGISGADKSVKGWRPIVCDNLNVGDGGKIVLVLQLEGGERKKVEVPVAYMKTFQGKQVVDLSAGSVPPAFVGKQAVCQFKEVAASFKEDPTTTYPNYDSGTENKANPRKLQTAQAGTSWAIGPATNPGGKCVFTDIMGDVINIDGNGILEYQLFCAYYIDGSAYRTMLHIG